MLEKKILLKHSIIFIMSLFLLIMTPVKCGKTCTKQNKDYLELSYSNFLMCENKGKVPVDYNGHVFFAKRYYHWFDEGWRTSYGHITKKIDFKRDFHLRFRNKPLRYPVDYFYYDPFNYGVAIVLGPHKSDSYRKYNVGEYHLIQDLEKSIVIIFSNFYRKAFLLNCQDSPCNIYDTPTDQHEFNELSQSSPIDIHVLYYASRNLIEVYKNDPQYDSNILLSFNDVHLTKFMIEDKGKGYVGFTSNDFYGQYFNDFLNTYICTNEGEKITPSVTLSYDKTTIENGGKINIPPLEEYELKVKYKTNLDGKLMGPGTIYIEGDEIPAHYTYDKNTYTYTYKLNAEVNYGLYELKYTTEYDSFIFKINVRSNTITRLNYAYGQYPDEKESSVVLDGVRYLKYGTLNGDFDLSELETKYNNYLYFYVIPEDEYQNECDIVDENIIKQEFINKNLEITLDKVGGDNHVYKIGIPVTKKGSYLISIFYFKYPISFTVINLIPSISNSNCKLEMNPQSAYDRNQEIKYICTFKDEDNDEINVVDSQREHNLKINTYLNRNDVFLKSIIGNCDKSKCIYSYTTGYNGKYKFETKIGFNDNMENIEITPNTFYVAPEPLTLAGCYFYNYDIELFININSVKNTIFNYYEDEEDNDNLLLIDLVDTDGSQITKYSDIEYSYDNFNPGKIMGKIVDNHTHFEEILSFEKTIFKEKPYILVKLVDSKTKMKRSSLYYTINLVLSISQDLKVNYVLPDLGGYIACGKALEIDNSIIKTINTNPLKAGSLGIIAQLVLRTDEDHIHNYFLDSIDLISFIEENYNCSDNKICEIKPIKSGIDGIYNLQFISNQAGEYKVKVQVNGTDLKEGNNLFNVKVEPILQAYYLEPIEPYEKKYTIGDNDIKFGFIIKDIYGNPIEVELPSDSFGLLYDITIGGEEPETKNVKLEKGDECYYIREYQTKSGDYKLTLRTIYSTEKIEFEYYKRPGMASAESSILKVMNTNKLNLHEEAKAEIYLYDIYGNSINADSESYDREIQFVDIYALNKNNLRVNYTKDSDNKFITEPLTLTGSYHIYGEVYGSGIFCQSPLFEVVDYGYEFSSSQLKMIAETIILMKKDNNYILYEGLQRPAFEFDFMTEDGLPSNEIEQNTTIMASIKNPNDKPLYLEKIWIDINKLLWVLPDDYELSKGEYILKVANNNTEYNYYIKIVEYGNDASSKDDYEILNTFVSPNILYLKAGISDSFIVELRDDNNLRYNKSLEPTKLTYKGSNLEITTRKGIKNGQIIVEVKSNKICEYSKKCNISMEYDGKEIKTKVQFVVSAGELNSFLVDQSSVLIEDERVLKPGTAGTPKKINLIPLDKYKNVIQDSIFDIKIYPEESFSKLFNLKNDKSEYSPSLTSSTNPVSHYVELSLSSEKAGILTLSSIYLDNEYTIEIKAGEPSKYSSGYLDGKQEKTSAGENSTFIIEPKDEKGNTIIDKTVIDNILDKFSIRIYDLDGNEIREDITFEYIKNKNHIEYVINNKKAKTKVVKAYYINEEIMLNNNVIYGVSGTPALDNSILKYNDKQYKISDKIPISLATLPIIDLQINDNFENQVDAISIFNDIDFYLIKGENQLSNKLPYNKDLRLYINDFKVDDYFQINKTQNECKLFVKIDDEKREINIIFEDEAPTEDLDKPVSFIMDTDDLVLKAGEKGIISLIFYTEKGKPMGYYFNPISQINLTCGSNEEIEYNVLLGKNYGQYSIAISSIHDIEGTCTVKAIEKSQNFTLKVIPNKVNNCKLSSVSPPQAVAGELYSINFLCYDEYGNEAHLIDGEFGALITDEDGQKVEYDINLDEGNKHNLYILPKKSGAYKIKSLYLKEEITFDTLPGEVSPENSYLEIQNNTKAGQEIEINIHVFDKYGNKAKLEENPNSIFDLYYRYQKDSTFSKYEKIDYTPVIDGNKIIYRKEVNRGGFNEFRGIHHDTSYIIKCQNCEVNVIPGEFNLNKSDVYKFNSFSKTYTKLSKYNDVLYNYEEDLFIRIYPKDRFGNKITAEDLELGVTISGYSLDNAYSNDEYIEFKETTGFFKTLNGPNELVIYYDGKTLSYKVYIAGKDDFDGEDIEPSNTKLLQTNLEFTAGQSGYFNFELRNSKNSRYSKAFNGNITLHPADEDVKCDIYNKHSSVILVVVKSEKANTFPNLRESNLELLVESEKVFDLELTIKPADLSTAQLLSENLEGNTLKINADKELRFSVIGRDEFGNLVVLNPNEAKLKVKNINNDNEVSYKLSHSDISTGQQKYVYDLTLAGKYEISSGTNDKKQDLFNNTIYIVEVESGELSPEKTIVKIYTTVTAGNNATAIISPKDKNNNEIIVDDILLGKFFAYILSNKYDFIIPSEERYTEKSFKYEAQLDKIGAFQYNVNYNGKKIKSEKVVVNPSSCNPKNTLIYSKDKNGQYVLYTEDTNAYSSITSPLNLRLVFRDDYYNIISNIRGIGVENAYLHGNNMQKLYWAFNNGELYLDLLNSNNKKIWEHLVTRTGKDGYTFTFEVEYNTKNKIFSLKVSHFSKKEDESDYGNGDYDLDKCKVIPEVAEFMAGTTFEVLLYLKTEEGLLFNGDFNMNSIDCHELTSEDETFSCSVSKNNIGIYSIKYYSTLYKREEDKIYNLIKLYNSDKTNTTTFKVLLINTNGIPSKKYTNITKKLPSKIREDGSNAVISFILIDEFGNTLKSDKIANDLIFENHDSPIGSTINFDQNSNEFSATLQVSYPPKDISIQLYYSNNNNKIELFNETQKSEFEFTIDFSKTVINSQNINRMTAGEFLDLNIITYDKNSMCYIDGDYSTSFEATVQGPLEKTIEKRSFSFKKDKGANCEYIYKIIIDESNYYVSTGTYSIVVYVNGISYSTFTQTVISADIDDNNFIISYIDMDGKSDQEIPVGETIYFMVQAYDKFKNKIDHQPLPSNSFEINVTPKTNANKIAKINKGSGALTCSFTTTIIGDYKFEYLYNQKTISANVDKGPRQVTFVSGECSAENPQVIYPSENDTDVSITYEYTIICLDKYGNKVSKGGAKFTSEISLYIEESQNTINIEAKIDDKGNGTYIISFIPPLLGGYSIYTYLDGNKYSELEFNLTEKEYDEKYTCPNDRKKHVNDLRDCIPKENRCDIDNQKIDKPFKCSEEANECVDSMTKCDAPKGAKKCIYMNALYPEGKEYLCSYSLPLDCKRKFTNYRIICDDGICRKSKALQPNQRVCPIGKVLCADLTCKDSVDECYNDWPECGSTQIRCPDQSCVDDQKNCPTTITCSNPDDYVCPDGTCVENEIYCSRIKTCPDEIPYLCSDNSCATQPENCPHTVACGHGKSLCSDLICRESC